MVRCDGNSENWNGVWLPNQQVGDQANYDDVCGYLCQWIKEHKCQGGVDPVTLVVTILDMGIGAQLICDIPDTDEDDLTYTITAPNNCVLLCEYHLAMVIESRLDDMGELKFYVTNVDPEEEINETNVSKKMQCWQ